MFTRLLIANRGEIACRIIQTARRLDIETIAVYADIEKHARHVRLADQAVCIGPAIPEQSYLNIDRILEVAHHTQADAIHPGYGFLSENHLFAEACLAANIVFVGPSPEAIRIMGSKQLSKTCLANTTVPLMPGYHQPDQSLAALQAAAQNIGFPLLIKAAAGGGGRGMRVVFEPADLTLALDSVKREGLAYFNDDTLILEKFMPNARHVEVQIMGDHQGNVLAIFDRDCSIQRRHQKIIEEAPAPNLTPAHRKQLHDAACVVAKTIKYVGAGTIEFLVNPDTEQFYFMEMNARLQVEHPVTEAITGLDLVEWQLLIADHQPLPLTTTQLSCHGHAFECRIYAEDPAHDFLPSTGQLTYVEMPVGAGIRVDTGYDQGDVLSPHYDALLAKLITHAPTREQALQLMQQALQQILIAGVKTNLACLQTICHHPAFMAGAVCTRFLSDYPCLSTETTAPLPVLLLFFADQYQRCLPNNPIAQACFGWSVQGLPRQWEQTMMIQDQPITATIEVATITRCILTVLEQRITLDISHDHDRLCVHDQTQHWTGKVICTGPQHWVCFYEGRPYLFQPVQSQQHSTLTPQHIAPMPGTVVAVLKKIGDPVHANDVILILEAMKMEHSIRAGAAGILDSLLCQTGDTVPEGTTLFTIKEDEDHAPCTSHLD